MCVSLLVCGSLALPHRVMDRYLFILCSMARLFLFYLCNPLKAAYSVTMKFFRKFLISF